MRPIDADTLKIVLDKNFGHTGGAAVMQQLIDAQPTIEPERKKGKWIHEQIESEKSITEYFKTPTCSCSICNAYVNQESNYCPNCGALMER